MLAGFDSALLSESCSWRYITIELNLINHDSFQINSSSVEDTPFYIKRNLMFKQIAVYIRVPQSSVGSRVKSAFSAEERHIPRKTREVYFGTSFRTNIVYIRRCKEICSRALMNVSNMGVMTSVLSNKAKMWRETVHENDQKRPYSVRRKETYNEWVSAKRGLFRSPCKQYLKV